MLRFMVYAVSVVIVLGIGAISIKRYMDNKATFQRLNMPFPSFNLEVLGDSGRTTTQDALLGRWTLVNVWGSWCGWCHAEHDYLMALAKNGVPIIGVSYKDAPKNASRFLDKLGDPYVFSVIDLKGELTEGSLDIHVAPVTLLVDREGNIHLKYVGILDQKIWETHFVPLIQQL